MCHFVGHALRLGQVFGSNVSRLETFTIVTTLLYVANGGTEERGTILLGNSEQGNFAIKVDKLFDDYFVNVATTAAHSIFPSML